MKLILGMSSRWRHLGNNMIIFIHLEDLNPTIIISNIGKNGELFKEVQKLRTDVRAYLRSVGKLCEEMELEMKK